MPKKQAFLIRQEIGAETVVYDSVSNQAHNLNDTAAWVLEQCDGKKCVDEVVELFAQRQGMQLEEARGALGMTLMELVSLKLANTNSSFAGALSRRDFLAKWGTAAAVLPIISSSAVPAAAVTASGCDCSANPVPLIDVVKTCIPGTRTHIFDMSASSHVCQICEFAVDIENNGNFEFASPTQNVFVFNYATALSPGDRMVGFRVLGPCFTNGPTNVGFTTLTFPIDCP